MTLFNYTVLPLVFVSGVWIPATLLCCIPWVQKQMLYLHWVTMWPGKWLHEPERAGFLKNQVARFRIPTQDGERLFAWLIAPLGVYAEHAEEFINEKSGVDGDIEDKMAFKLLRDDPEARLLVYFHGNSATIAQGRRTEEYRMYSSGASDKIFTLTFDYRGFGRSTGSPSETGLLNDGTSVLEWALNLANVSSDRIVLLGHSLGTAVATGVAHHYINHEPPVQFSGLILGAAFTNSGSAFTAYSLADVFPILAPVKTIPLFQAWFSRRMVDTWDTSERLAHLISKSPSFRLVLVHAKDDTTMPWDQSEEIFKSTVQAGVLASQISENSTLTDEEIVEKVGIVDLGEAGRQEVWSQGQRSVSKLIANHGGHNTMMKWGPVSLALLQCFDLVPTSSTRALSVGETRSPI
ncbi:alpha/beta-hydrolase [Lindgomyces ingoldianus]|uniref:Alpha/beta-hydrolase n=1 Tax=Lindgomyces ingoldianus TaxID=673940 RepID=A0ACB6R309_9PLEO|nr:alpha/beta-hydrolase [Lindgomyces ingoldianus]KAF2472715.1 alpha/beta-hydrolase [Lindgomyces ingoldianus]